MKMLNNVLGADVFAISRTPIQSPQSTKMEEGDLRCVARPPERPAQVHQDHHAEDGAVAVAEHADGAEPVDEEAVLHKRYKNRGFPSIVPKNAMGPRRKRQRRTTRRSSRRRRMKGGTMPYVVDVKKGFKLLTDPAMWKIPSKADVKADKQRVANYKRQYRASGSKDSYVTWAKKKGYVKRAGCSLM